MSETFLVTENYKRLSAFRVTSNFMSDNKLSTGPIELLVRRADIELRHTATLNANGTISKSAAVYKHFQIATGEKVELKAVTPGELQITLPLPADNGNTVTPPIGETVFDRKKVKHIHFQVFSPAALDKWEPKNETDVFFVFGVLQEFVPYSYCCGMSQQVVEDLGYTYAKNTSKPDAIVVEDDSGDYLVAEWKKNSSAFTTNHHKEDVDVLIVWEDDSTERASLPPVVLELKQVARAAASEFFNGKS